MNSPRVGGSLCGNFSSSRTVPSGKLAREMFVLALAENEFRAPAADVQQQQRRLRQFRVGGHALKHPFGLLLAGNDFDFEIGRAFDGRGEVAGIHRVARGAGGDDADGIGISFARDLGELPDGLGGAGDGFGLEPVRFVKALAEPRLAAFLVHRPHVAPRHIGHQQLDRVGADINDGAANGFHEAQSYKATGAKTQVKKCYILRGLHRAR